MEEKREDLDSEKQTELLQRLVKELSQTHIDLYYQPTSQIALILKKHIDDGVGLQVHEKTLLEPLSQRDIEIKLSIR